MQKLFAYGFVPAPGSLVAGVSKLPAGAQARFELDSGALRVQRYWRFLVEPEEALDDGDEPRLVEELRHLIQQAVCRRLISDVPLGIFLSGGIDSSSVLGMAAREREPSSIETFTVGFREPTFDESTHARLVATAVGTRHHEELLDLSVARELIPTVLQAGRRAFRRPLVAPDLLCCAVSQVDTSQWRSQVTGPTSSLPDTIPFARLLPPGSTRASCRAVSTARYARSSSRCRARRAT